VYSPRATDWDTTVTVDRRLDRRVLLNLISPGLVLDLLSVRMSGGARAAAYAPTIIGLAVDWATGRALRPDPREVVVRLPAQTVRRPQPPLPEGAADSIAQAFLARLANATACPDPVKDLIRTTDHRMPTAAAAFVFDPVVDSTINAHVRLAQVDLEQRCATLSPYLEAVSQIGIPADTAALELGTEDLLAPVYFAFGDSMAVADSVRERLLQAARVVMENPLREFLQITVIGFTDPAGDGSVNLRLGEARARRVRDLLVQAGVTECCRIESHGEDPFFLAVPGAAGRTDQRARANRRVDFVLSLRGG
ncbi:MAG: OmpA family protein, partial [Gemmatimonadales bacterium]